MYPVIIWHLLAILKCTARMRVVSEAPTLKFSPLFENLVSFAFGFIVVNMHLLCDFESDELFAWLPAIYLRGILLLGDTGTCNDHVT